MRPARGPEQQRRLQQRRYDLREGENTEGRGGIGAPKRFHELRHAHKRNTGQLIKQADEQQQRREPPQAAKWKLGERLAVGLASASDEFGQTAHGQRMPSFRARGNACDHSRSLYALFAALSTFF